MGECWRGNPEVSGLSPGPVKVFFAIFKNCSKVPGQFFLDLFDLLCLLVKLGATDLRRGPGSRAAITKGTCDWGREARGRGKSSGWGR